MSIQQNVLGPLSAQGVSDPYGALKNFEVIKKLGYGHFSVVYSARNRFNNVYVALKKVELSQMADAKAIEDCKREISLLQQLNHPNVIKYISHFVEENDLYIVLELASAGDLAQMIKHFIKTNKRMTEKTIWKFFRQICSGLEHMHSKRIMHRDIKPANIFVSAEGIVRLGDLGLGRFFGSKTNSAHSMVGTPYYMSPERIHEHDLGYDFRSDIWSLGCILYEMAALRSPFYGENLNLVLLRKKILSLDYAPLPANIFSHELRHLVARCLVLDPEQRPDITEVNHIAQVMYARFVEQANTANNTPTPTPTSRDDSACGNEHCFTTPILILTTFGFVSDQPPDSPFSDATSILKPTNSGEVCNLPYKVRNYTWDMYFCYRGSCPTATSTNSACASGQYAGLQLFDNNIQTFQLKTESSGINGINEQSLIYYYYMPNISQKSITVRKEEVSGSNDIIDIVTSSPYNRWIKRQILFNATMSGYKLYFDLQKTSSEMSLIDIGLDEISIRQISRDDEYVTTDTLTTITTPIIDIVSSSVPMIHTSMLIVPDISTTKKLETTEAETVTLTVVSSNQVLYECDFDNASLIDNCFTPGTIVVTNIGNSNVIAPNGPLSDVTSSLEPTDNGEVCKLPYQIDSYDWDMYFCNEGYCPTESSSNSTCKFGFVQLLTNDKKSFQLKTESVGINGIGQQCLIYYYYMDATNDKIITINKEETNGTMEIIDSVTRSPFNGWIQRKISFNTEAFGYKIYFEVQRTSGVREPYVGFDEISIHQGSCDNTLVTNDLMTSKISDVSSSIFITTLQTTMRTSTVISLVTTTLTDSTTTILSTTNDTTSITTSTSTKTDLSMIPTTTSDDNVAASNNKTLIIILSTVIPAVSIAWIILILWLKKSTFKNRRRRSKKRKHASKTVLELNRVAPV
ncbi:unnamed protein product [Rotaria sordida]|uniref:NEK6-subfamily protein kinase n=1 Tax=Rotaria sordida TaxID=392033 RepID=A0A818QPM5_9BILA|nr:unnamed protein product [Rotaria sordida]